MDTNILILGIALLALFYFFSGGSRRRAASGEEQDQESGRSSGGGCCGGNNTQRQKGDTHDEVEAWIDPVCGMPVESENAAAMKRYQGIAFYFCSDKCLAEFSRNPRKYSEEEELDHKPPPKNGGNGCCG